jgi:hypothetical protein
MTNRLTQPEPPLKGVRRTRASASRHHARMTMSRVCRTCGCLLRPFIGGQGAVKLAGRLSQRRRRGF